MSSVSVLPGPSSVAAPSPRSVPWIISKREDLIWFIGSSVVSYLALALMASGVPVLPIQLVWFFFIDGPHVFSTATRTYFDKEERSRLGWFLWLPVPLLLIGPAMALAGYASLFFLIAFCWQQFHVVKQHFGFMMIYKAKNGEKSRHDFILDRWFLLSSFFVPLAIFLIRAHPDVFRDSTLVMWAENAMIAAYVFLAAGWIMRQAWKVRNRQALNAPKLALLVTLIPLQWFALLYASQYGAAGILRASIPLGLFHGLQYHRLMWFHNHNRYSLEGASGRHGVAVRLASSALKYLFVGVALNVLLTFLPQVILPSQILPAAVWGFAFAHYCLDARIWHVRSDRGLAAALKMA
jgi:hypothetical protein